MFVKSGAGGVVMRAFLEPERPTITGAEANPSGENQPGPIRRCPKKKAVVKNFTLVIYDIIFEA